MRLAWTVEDSGKAAGKSVVVLKPQISVPLGSTIPKLMTDPKRKLHGEEPSSSSTRETDVMQVDAPSNKVDDNTAQQKFKEKR